MTATESEWAARLAAAEEENVRLREALEEITAHHADQVECWQDADEFDQADYHRERADIARRALAPKEDNHV